MPARTTSRSRLMRCPKRCRATRMPTRRPRPTRCNGRQLPARAATGRNGRSRGQEGPQGNDAEARPGARRAPRVRGRAARGAGRRQDQVHHGHTTRQGLQGAPRHRHGAVQKVRQDVRGGERPAGTGLVRQELGCGRGGAALAAGAVRRRREGRGLAVRLRHGQIRGDRRARAGRGRLGTDGEGREGNRLAGGGSRRAGRVAGRDPGPDPSRPVGPQPVRHVPREQWQRGDRRARGRVRGMRGPGRPPPARGARSGRQAPGMPGARAARRRARGGRGRGASGPALPARGPVARVRGGPAAARRGGGVGAAAPGHVGDAGARWAGTRDRAASCWKSRRPGSGGSRALLAFPGHPGAEPTNNSGRAPRCDAASRETSGQIKGGPAAMGRMPGFVARGLAWGRTARARPRKRQS